VLCRSKQLVLGCPAGTCAAAACAQAHSEQRREAVDYGLDLLLPDGHKALQQVYDSRHDCQHCRWCQAFCSRHSAELQLQGGYDGVDRLLI
jgi:cobalamin biosynthesis protein CbiD